MIINGVRWRVRLVSPAHPMLLTPHKTHALGVCDKVTQTICIDETLSPQELKEVLCHEIVHAAMFSYNVELTLEQEELIADLIASYGEQIVETADEMFKKIKGAY